MAKIVAPWSWEQVIALNAWQANDNAHAFTCGGDHGTQADRTLLATPGGWVCTQCDYKQNWAHDFMAQPQRRMIEQLTIAQVERIDAGHCPDCGHRGFVLGPRGGAAQNIECGGCRARFNVSSASFSHHIVMAQRIPKQEDGGSDWGSK